MVRWSSRVREWTGTRCSADLLRAIQQLVYRFQKLVGESLSPGMIVFDGEVWPDDAAHMSDLLAEHDLATTFGHDTRRRGVGLRQHQYELLARRARDCAERGHRSARPDPVGAQPHR